MADIEQEARAEAEKRWGDRALKDRLPKDWLDEGMASGFVLGALWAASRPASPATAQIVSSGGQSGKTAAMVDALLDRANERGIRVEIVEPAPAARVSPKIADHLDRLARDVAYTEGHASVMRAAADVIRGSTSPATGETVTEEMVERAARAIHDAHRPVEGPVPEWDSDSDQWRSTYRDFARAALEAALTEKGDDRGEA